MGTIYFLGVVAVCAIVFVWLLGRSAGRKRSQAAARGRHTKPLYQHRMSGHTVLGSHTGNLPSETHDMWHTRRPHAQKEHWDEAEGTRITATRLRSDDEADERDDDEMTMGTIEFTPTKISRTGSDDN
ncbi:hypothetical protein [Elongatibacter sediminis]|uniref:Uncharacterized protein n=1 Tax=Elongatibacter sediminis TaxID=3119006 RepID=A0AAW9REJ5_9GAMM